MSQFRKVDVDNMLLFNLSLDTFMLNTQIPRDHKVLNYIIEVLKVAYNMKLIPHSVLKKIDITFTTDLQIYQFADRYGHVFTDHNSHAISCEGVTL